MQHMYKANITGGLFPTMWNVQDGLPTNCMYELRAYLNYCSRARIDHHSVGAYADSAHEYLLKQWLLTGQSEPKAKNLCEQSTISYNCTITKVVDLQSVEGILTNLTYISPKRHLLYVTDMSSGMTSHKFEHLSCFLPGLLALGVYTLPELSPRDKELHMWAAKGLAYTCYITYADHATGLGPDEIMMHRWSPSPEKGRWLTQLEEWEAQESRSGPPPGLEEVPANATDRDYYPFRDSYLLRPEVCVLILEAFIPCLDAG